MVKIDVAQPRQITEYRNGRFGPATEPGWFVTANEHLTTDSFPAAAEACLAEGTKHVTHIAADGNDGMGDVEIWTNNPSGETIVEMYDGNGLNMVVLIPQQWELVEFWTNTIVPFFHTFALLGVARSIDHLRDRVGDLMKRD